jgi:hypothetical protein
MGIDINGLRFLKECASRGVDFSTTCTIGRQGLHISPAERRRIAKAWSLSTLESASTPEWSNAIFSAMGCRTLVSLDASPYEGADIIHDMNKPIAEELVGKYSCVIDGGSLEHVFDVKTAWQNALSMVAPGGSYLFITPLNNLAGHGFYQFSPEFIFSMFQPRSGFTVDTLLAAESYPNAPFFHIANPLTLGRRVTLRNAHPVWMYGCCKRLPTETSETLELMQSDYLVQWQSSSPSSPVAQADQKRTALPDITGIVPPRIRVKLKNGLMALTNAFTKPEFTPASLPPI